MQPIIRDDGTPIEIVPGFRERALSYRTSTSPRPHWTDADYSAAAEKKLSRFERLVAELNRFRKLEDAEVLEIGCGAGINSLLLATRGVKRIVGIDLALPMQEETPARLIEAILARAGISGGVDRVLREYPIELKIMDAQMLDFADSSFDLILSRSAMEHIDPIETALAEMSRVLRVGGIVHHAIDPFYWLRGCHKRGVIDIPFAHARLSDAEFERFVTQTEGPAKASERLRRLQTLNRFTIARWRKLIDNPPFRMLDWREDASDFSSEVLNEFPRVLETLQPHVIRHDLVTSRITATLMRI